MATATAIRPDTITLDTLRDGAAIDLFDEQLQKALENIRDDRTVGEKARKVVLTVVLQPYVIEKVVDRSRVFVNVTAKADLAPIESGDALHRVEITDDGFQLAIAF